MLKKIIIKIFRLKDISALLIKARLSQKKLDEKYWTERLEEQAEQLNNEHELELQELQSQITLLQDQIADYKKRERELDKKDFYVRTQAKEGALIATRVSSKTAEFGMCIMNLVGEMQGIKDEAEKHKIRVESKKYELG